MLQRCPRRQGGPPVKPLIFTAAQARAMLAWPALAPANPAPAGKDHNG